MGKRRTIVMALDEDRFKAEQRVMAAFVNPPKARCLVKYAIKVEQETKR